MHQSDHLYHDNQHALLGHLAYDAAAEGKRPAVMVVHDWSGRNDFACAQANHLAELGYVGFAVDMFGDGKHTTDENEKMAFIKPFLDDRAALKARILAAFDTVSQLPTVDPQRIGVIGFCFGGLCALDLARTGAPLRCAVSFHGLLNPPLALPKQTITAKLLVLHGYDDPMVRPSDTTAFADEMSEAGVDWQMHMYSQTQHAFMNPAANDPATGKNYQPRTAQRAWQSMVNFLYSDLLQGMS